MSVAAMSAGEMVFTKAQMPVRPGQIKDWPIWGLMAGGPNGGIYKSTNAGSDWKKLVTGLPEVDVGKIGLAVTVANPDLVYATIEANDDNKGFYRSADQGESWTYLCM